MGHYDTYDKYMVGFVHRGAFLISTIAIILDMMLSCVQVSACFVQSFVWRSMAVLAGSFDGWFICRNMAVLAE